MPDCSLRKNQLERISLQFRIGDANADLPIFLIALPMSQSAAYGGLRKKAMPNPTGSHGHDELYRSVHFDLVKMKVVTMGELQLHESRACVSGGNEYQRVEATDIPVVIRKCPVPALVI
jgi:hypothetical protein